jgi:aspartyl-tRNA(Asn)/glutamyl-tRNA(Gln) amidotransferase subunit A
MSDWWKASAAELARAYRERRASPVEVIEEFLRRCAELNPTINAVVTIDAVGARAAAQASERRWRAGSPLSGFDGVPVSVKDSLQVQGMRSTWGSRLYADFVPARDELPVARLRAAGAVIVGKTNVPEFTLQGYTDNPLYGVTRNPWNPALTPGGSSGGAVAAVAAGLGPLALATDGGGSTRRPASHTGLLGLKPSRGRVPRSDGFPAILLDFEVLGLIARTVGDLEDAMRVLSGADPRDAASLAFARLPFAPPAPRACRILYAARIGDSPVDPEVGASVAAAARTLASLGHRVEEAGEFDIPQAANDAWPVISQVGLAWLLAGHPDWRGGIGAALASMADTGAAMPATRYLGALDAARRTHERLRALFAQYDLLLTPTAAALPWPAAESHPPQIDGRAVGPRGHAIFTAFVNAAGCPALSVPCRPSSAGLPIGFQLIAPFGEDGLLCTIARQFEAAEPWAARWPPLCSLAAAT